MNSNLSFKYSAHVDGPQLVCNNQEDTVSVCMGNGSWYPNLAEIVCSTQLIDSEGLFPYMYVIPNAMVLYIITRVL